MRLCLIVLAVLASANSSFGSCPNINGDFACDFSGSKQPMTVKTTFYPKTQTVYYEMAAPRSENVAIMVDGQSHILSGQSAVATYTTSCSGDAVRMEAVEPGKPLRTFELELSNSGDMTILSKFGTQSQTFPCVHQ